MAEQGKDHASGMSDSSQRLFAVALNSADPAEPDNYWVEFYWAENDEHAEEQAQNAHPTSAVLSTPASVPYVPERKNELSESHSGFDSDVLPEGLSPWRGKPGEIEIQDAQAHTWVTLHAGANGDPITWRNTITTRVFTALGIDPREMAR